MCILCRPSNVSRLAETKRREGAGYKLLIFLDNRVALAGFCVAFAADCAICAFFVFFAAGAKDSASLTRSPRFLVKHDRTGDVGF